MSQAGGREGFHEGKFLEGLGKGNMARGFDWGLRITEGMKKGAAGSVRRKG